jgi:hypothetical protein
LAVVLPSSSVLVGGRCRVLKRPWPHKAQSCGGASTPTSVKTRLLATHNVWPRHPQFSELRNPNLTSTNTREWNANRRWLPSGQGRALQPAPYLAQQRDRRGARGKHGGRAGESVNTRRTNIPPPISISRTGVRQRRWGWFVSHGVRATAMGRLVTAWVPPALTSPESFPPAT